MDGHETPRRMTRSCAQGEEGVLLNPKNTTVHHKPLFLSKIFLINLLTTRPIERIIEMRSIGRITITQIERGSIVGLQIFVPDRGVLIGQREKLGLSQEEVTKKAGITLKQYQMYESHEGREFSSSSMRIVNAVLTVLELDPTAFAKGKYSLRDISEDDLLDKLKNKI